jgi:DNA-binding XRE family transcriptional regulator
LTLWHLMYIVSYMKSTKPRPDDAPGQSLLRLGSRIRMARTRRKLRQQDLARQIGRARATVVAIEKGSPTTEIGAYVAALWALGLLQELDLVADPGLDRDGQALTFSAADKRVRPRQQLDNKF